VNGTKRFKISFDVPIQRLGNGWGSYGLIGILEATTNEFYHPWWNSTWKYRRNITINNTQNTNTLTDYQVAINLTYSSNMQPDFSDIRFTWYNSTDGTETEIPYWIENYYASQNATVWVKVPQIPASSYATIYVYYGNTTPVSSASNAKNTFIIGEDFSDNQLHYNWDNLVSGCYYLENGMFIGYSSGTSGSCAYGYDGLTDGILLVNNATFTPGVAVVGMYKRLGSGERDNEVPLAYDIANWNRIENNYKGITNSIEVGVKYANTYYYNIYSFAFSTDVWYKRMYVWNSSGVYAWVNGNYIGSFTDTTKFYSSYKIFAFDDRSNTAGNFTMWDYVYARKYSLPEPTYSIGAEEIHIYERSLGISFTLPVQFNRGTTFERYSSISISTVTDFFRTVNYGRDISTSISMLVEFYRKLMPDFCFDLGLKDYIFCVIGGKVYILPIAYK
jgi:hypothetical protein